MNFQDGDITLAWEEILSRDDYHLKLVDIQDSYPDKKSLFVSYNDIDMYNTELASYILANPDRAIYLGKKVIKEMLPVTWEPGNIVNLRITELPKDAKIEVRQIRAKHLGRLVAVEGLVRKATTPRPRLTRALYRCAKCDSEVWMPQDGMIQKEPLLCVSEGCNKSAPHFILDDRNSEYTDTQKVEIQENPEGLRGGAQPERMSGYIEDDLAGQVSPGNRITLNGILRSVQKLERDKTTIFEVFMDVLSVESEQSDFSEVEITEEDEAEILRMSRDPEILDKIVRSIAPTIYGMEYEKQAVALQLFGGSHKTMDDGSTIRGDIHILMIGDPGVAKSQILRYMSSLSPRGIYASGKSASAAGLCIHGDTVLETEKGPVPIGEFVESRMDSPEEYRPGIWRQAVEGDRIEAPSDLGSLRLLPITYVWRIRTPERLVRITTATGDSIILTPETKIQAMHDGCFDWVESSAISAGDMVPVSKDNMRMYMVLSVESLTDGLPEYVYDLTVEPSHSFIAGGFTVHNTAAAVKDDFGDGRWTLEAGALVLADKGLACIDELDKMTDQDRSSLHEAMESQRISVAKAGITATLQCRCSLLAAANPKQGRFDDEKMIADQINLPPALMSRFDLMFVMKDQPDAKRDKMITDHILNGHRRGQARALKSRGEELDELSIDGILEETSGMKPPYGVDILRKYVAYAKKNITPVMTPEAKDLIMTEYLKIRGMTDNGSIPITARQLEAYVRLSEASAKVRLSRTVDAEDADRAIALITYYITKIASSGSGYDIDLAGGVSSNKDRKAGEIINEIISRYTPQGGVTETILIQDGLNEGLTASTIKRIVEARHEMGDIIRDSLGRYKVV